MLLTKPASSAGMARPAIAEWATIGRPPSTLDQGRLSELGRPWRIAVNFCPVTLRPSFVKAIQSLPELTGYLAPEGFVTELTQELGSTVVETHGRLVLASGPA